jgi:hypothetical protein
MSISYTGADTPVVEKPKSTRMLFALMLVNSVFATTSVFWWTFMSLFVAEPIKWATWTGISSRPDLFEYPFSLLWMIPGTAVCAAWLAHKAGKRRMALNLVIFPIVFLGLLFGWYYLAPQHLR